MTSITVSKMNAFSTQSKSIQMSSDNLMAWSYLSNKGSSFINKVTK